jgi:AbrB family looped-hinge helix DNA binding protein
LSRGRIDKAGTTYYSISIDHYFVKLIQGASMSPVTVSSKYQVVIPKEARRLAHIRPGEKMLVTVKGDVITMIPDRPFKDLRGVVKGLDRDGLREKVERD